MLITPSYLVLGDTYENNIALLWNWGRSIKTVFDALKGVLRTIVLKDSWLYFEILIQNIT